MAMAAALTTTQATAQTRVNVPFRFTVSGTICPAGNYSIQPVSFGSSVLRLQGEDWKETFSWAFAPAGASVADAGTVLTFDEVDGTHVLRTIQYRDLISPVLDYGGTLDEQGSR
jgi:hypothetical protein